MKRTPYRVGVLAIVCIFAIQVFATPGGRSQSGPNVLGSETDLNIVNKVIAPDGFPRS